MIDKAITMVLSGANASQCADVIKVIASSTESAEVFVRGLIARKTGAGDRLDTFLPEVQQLFEGIANYSEASGCIFMAHLRPIVSLQIGMHEVSDAIDLWLENHRGVEIMEHLRCIASTAEPEVAREHFRKLIARMS